MYYANNLMALVNFFPCETSRYTAFTLLNNMQITANLVKQQLKVSQDYVHALDMNTAHIIEGVEVTLLDANQ